MTQKASRPEFGDLIVEATLADIEKGARRVIGPRMKASNPKKGVHLFEDDAEACPMQVTATLLKQGVYRLDVGSRCTVKDCDYFAKCQVLDTRALKSLKQAMTELLGTGERVHDSSLWRPERLRDDEKLRRLVDRLLGTGS
jgi:hypothetical protein